MSKSISPNELNKAIAEQLTLYREDVIDKVNAAGEKAIKSLVKQTKATVPRRTGNYRRAITYTEQTLFTGDKEYHWGAKAPHHRLTHLLVNGHAKKNGGRVDGDPFLENALVDVLVNYEKDVEEALKHDR